MDFLLHIAISPGLHILFLPSERHLLFPSTRWESLSTLMLHSSLSLSPPASQSFLNTSFYLVYSSFWSLIPFSLPARPVSTLNDLHLIKCCTFLSPFWMGLTNPGQALGWSSQLLISWKLLTLSGILPFSISSFRLASLLALRVGLHLSFLIGVHAWFIKITKIASFESVEVFCKDSFLALYFFLSLHQWSPSFSAFFRQLLSLCWWSGHSVFFPSVPNVVEATQEALFWLERWCEYWCLPFNLRKCEASFFSVYTHQANLQPNLLLLGSHLRFNPTPTFIGVTFDHTFSFSKHVSLLKAKFFPHLKALCFISDSSWGPS